MPTRQWRIAFCALVVLTIAMPLIHRLVGPVSWSTVLTNTAILGGCGALGWLQMSGLIRWKPAGDLAGALAVIVPAVLLAVILSWLLHFELAGEAVALYLGFSVLRGTQPPRI